MTFYEDVDVQLEGGRALAKIGKLSRVGLDLKNKALGWRCPVLNHIKSFINTIIFNTTDLLERQKRLGAKAVVQDDVTACSHY